MWSFKKLLLFAFLASAVLPLKAQNFKSLMDKANKQYELKAFNLAVRHYEDALQKRPEDAEAQFKLADCYRHLNQMEAAAQWFGRAVRQRKTDPLTPLYYGHVLKALGRYGEAFEQYKEYSKRDPVAGEHYAASCNYARAMLLGDSDYEVLNEAINTNAAEFGATFYGAGQVVYSSGRKDIQRSSTDWTGSALNQLFAARMNSETGALSSPIFFPSTVGESFNQGPLSFSADGRMVVFTKNNFVDGTRWLESSGLELNLFEAEVSGEGYWTRVVPFAHNVTGHSTGFPSLSPDGERLYFASDRPDGYGGFDIYVSYKVSGRWTEPENLGPIVNSPGNEITPFFDGTDLYFSSNWHHGLGGYDVFKARANNNRWVEVVNEGLGINTSRDDYGFVMNGVQNTGYLTSNRLGGRGAEDIYRVQGVRSQILLSVRNAADGTPIAGAEIDFGSCGNGVVTADVNGMYRFKPIAGATCNLIIRKEGYQDAYLSLNTTVTGESKMVPVNMSRVGEAYKGVVIDYRTRAPQKGISVFATNVGTSSYLATVTDEFGEYSLALASNEIYQVRYSGPGYRELHRTVRTDGRNNNVLGIVSIMSSDGPAIPGQLPPDLIEKDPGLNEDRIVSGFSVQVSALRKANLGEFERLRSIGVVYSVKEDNLMKVRVGVFIYRDQALLALKKIQKEGYKGAFIVEEKGTIMEDNLPKKESDLSPKTPAGWSIQLGAYRNPNNFDGSRVGSLGTITETKRSGLTIKLLSGFVTEQEARNMLGKVRSSGFPGAFVVRN